MNLLPQTLHLNGRSPVCDRMWICSAESDPKTFPQYLQRCLKNGSLRPFPSFLNDISSVRLPDRIPRDAESSTSSARF